MKPILSWAVVSRKTNTVYQGQTYATRAMARKVRGESVGSFRVTRVRVSEVRK